MILQHMQIGEVAEGTGLSLRTIRYYEEMGLVRPSVEDMRDMLSVLDALESDMAAASQRDALSGRLARYREAADARVRALRDQLATAEEFAKDLRREISRQRRLAGSS